MFKFLDTSELGNGTFSRVQNVFYSKMKLQLCLHAPENSRLLGCCAFQEHHTWCQQRALGG